VKALAQKTVLPHLRRVGPAKLDFDERPQFFNVLRAHEHGENASTVVQQTLVRNKEN
jgi:hypothetical protein